MADYWSMRPKAPDLDPTTAPAEPTEDVQESEYDHRRQRMLNKNLEASGWEGELHRYLRDNPPGITKTLDLVEWWEVRINHSPRIISNK